MSTTVAPADDMSITVGAAGVVLVYKARSIVLRERDEDEDVTMNSAPQFVKNEHPERDNVRVC